MEPIPIDQHELVIQLLRDNQTLLLQNNELLKKQEKRERRRIIFKIIWYTILLGIPILAYYYLYNMFVGVLGGGDTVNMGDLEISSSVLKNLLETYTGQY